MSFQAIRKRAHFLLGLLLAITVVVSSFQHTAPNPAAAGQQLTLAKALVDEGKYELAIPELKKVLAVFEQMEDWEQWLAVCETLDACYTELDEMEEGIQFFKTAVTKVEDLPKATHLKPNLLLLLAIFYHNKGDYTNAGQLYEQGMELAEAQKDNRLLPAYYSNLSLIYWDNGDYLKALELQKKSLQIALAEGDTANLPELLYFIGDTYRTLNDRQALDYFHRCLALQPEDKNAKLVQLSKVYQQFGMLDSAFAVLDQILPNLQHEVEKADCYYQYARLYHELHKPVEALVYIQKALPFGLKGYGERHSEYARMTSMAGIIYRANGNADKALQFFQQTLENQCLSTEKYALTANPPLDQLPPGSFWVLNSLVGKGQVFYQKYKESSQPENLQYALAAFESGLGYGEKMRLSYGHESSKIELYGYLKPAVEGCVKTALAMAEQTGDAAFFEKAFLFAEQTKASVMAEALYGKEIKHLADIPAGILEQEKANSDNVSGWQTALYLEDDPDLKREYKDSLAEAQFQLSALHKRLEKEFPRYYELKYAFHKNTNLKQLRQNLAEGTLLVEYFMGDSALYTFALSKNELKVYTSPKTAQFTALLQQFRRSVSDPHFVQDSAELAQAYFLNSAASLYDCLLAKPLSEIKATKLVIVPDGVLAQIPFSVLLTKPHTGSWKDRNIPYLIKDYAISQAWSAATLEHKATPESAVKYGFGGFGTTYDAATLTLMNKGQPVENQQQLAWRDFGSLPQAVEEVTTISKYLHGKTWLNENATKANFLTSAPNCGVLHLALHGALNEENPMLSSLVFNKSAHDNDNQLFASELYNMNLRARLVVLSSCHSGYGKMAGGEGNMSVARAFAYAGCPALVSNLWKANDQATATLMGYFYQSLAEGQSTSEALRSANLKYLATASPEYSTPIYWAGFVMIGEDMALPTSMLNSQNYSLFYIMAGLLALALLYWIVRRY